MVEGSPGAVALISIHPRFANAILDGTKQVEFRKVGFKRLITHALLYATAPIQQIVGYVEVADVEERSPAALWRRYRAVAGIEREAFFAYYQGKATGVALKVQRPQRLLRPLALNELHRGATPPQSFLYTTADALRRLQARGSQNMMLRCPLAAAQVAGTCVIAEVEADERLLQLAI